MHGISTTVDTKSVFTHFLKYYFRNDTRLNQNNHDLNEIKEKRKTPINLVEANLKDLIVETKSSLENKINDVEIDLNTRLITIQDQVSDIQTDVNNVKTSFGSFQDSTNKELTKVWVKFKEIDKKIANLPKTDDTSGSCKRSTRSYIAFYSLIFALLNFK